MRRARRKPLTRDFRLKAAWLRTQCLLSLLAVISCPLLILYTDTTYFTCTMRLQRLRFPVMAESKHCQFSLAVLLSLWSYCRAVSFYGERTLQTSSCNARQTGKRRAVVHNATLTLWVFAVLFAAGPSSVYSTVKAVPGFLRVSSVWEWIMSQGISLCMAALTSVGLPALAKWLCKSTSRFSVIDLVVVG
eukprot:32698-Amphidinium_carterae.1